MAELGEQITVRNVDPAVWHAARVRALDQGVTMGALVTTLLRAWLNDERLGEQIERQRE